MKQLFGAILLLLCTRGLHARQVPLSKNFWLEEENTAVRVNQLCMDHQSYLFLATDKGLYRFNGAKFSLIRSKIKSPVTAVSAYRDQVWLAYKNGTLGTVQNDSVVPLILPRPYQKAEIKCLLPQADHTLWIGTDNGLYLYRDKQVQYFNTDKGLSDNFIYQIVSSANGHIWLATDYGINELIPVNNTFSIKQYKTKEILGDDIVSAMAMINGSELLLGAEKGKLAKLNINTKQLIPLKLSAQPEGQILSILPLNNNEIWFSTINAQLWRLNALSSDSCIAREMSLPQRVITTLLADKSGNLWAGSQAGLSMLSDRYMESIALPAPYQLSDLTALAIDVHNEYWIALGKDLYQYGNDEKMKKVRSFPSKISVLHFDKETGLWLGTSANGVWRKSKESSIFEQPAAFEDNSDGILSISTVPGYLWVAGLSGLHSYKVEGNNMRSVQLFKDQNQVSGEYIYKLVADPQNNLWMATDGSGISLFKQNQKLSNWATLGTEQEDVVYSLATAGNDNTWAASMDNNIYSLKGEQWQLFKSSESGHTITGLQLNASGQLIAGYQNCVDLWYPQQRVYRHFNARLGMGIDSFSHLLNTGAKDQNGNVYLPYNRGLLCFKNQEQPFEIRPDVVLKAVFANSEQLRGPGLTLSAGDYLLNFYYDGISYTNPENLHYRYRLEGYNEEWIYTRDPEAVFPKLKWGNYTFRVQVSLSADFSHARETGYSFTIATPLLYKRWFQLLLALSVIGLSFFIVKWRERRMKRIAQLKEEKLNFEFEYLKSQVNPHFLFNSLNTLTGLIEEDQANAVIYTERLSDLYRHSIVSYGKDKASLAEEIELLYAYIYIQEARFGKALQIEIEVTEQQQRLYFLPMMALQLVVENAIKHNVVSHLQPLVVKVFVAEEVLMVVNKINLKISRETHGGIGLKNIERRYKMLSGLTMEYGAVNDCWLVKLPLLK